MIYLTAICALELALVVFLLVDRARERDHHAHVLAVFVKDATAERASLLQRIQAPEKAVQDYSDAQVEPSEEQPWLGWDEDPESRLTKEQLAEIGE